MRAVKKSQTFARQLHPQGCTRRLRFDAVRTFPWKRGVHVIEAKEDGIRYLFQIRPPGSSHNYLTSKRVSKRTRLLVEKQDKVPLFRDMSFPEELHDTVIDGEILSNTGGISSDTQTAMAKGDVHYVVWDILFLSGEDLRGLPLRERWSRLTSFILNLPKELKGRIRLVDRSYDIPAFLDKMIRLGKEGGVIKDQDATYDAPDIEDLPKPPVGAWTKAKDENETDCIVTGFKPAKPHTKYDKAGLIGAVEVSQFVPMRFGLSLGDREFKERFRNKCVLRAGRLFCLFVVGTMSGFKEDKRAQWSDKKQQRKMIGQTVVEVQYQLRMKKTGRFRHIRYSRVRGEDKKPQDCVWL